MDNENSIETSDIRQLLYFMERIRSFEVIYSLQNDCVVRLIFGVMIIISGIIATLFELEEISHFGLPWFLGLGGALVIQEFIQRYLPLEPRKKNKEKYSRNLPLYSVMFILAIGLALIGLGFLSYPVIAILSIYLIYQMDEDYYSFYNEYFSRDLTHIVPFFGALSVIVNLIGFLIEPEFLPYHSLIFGAFYGGSLVSVAIINHYAIERYIDKLSDFETD